MEDAYEYEYKLPCSDRSLPDYVQSACSNVRHNQYALFENVVRNELSPCETTQGQINCWTPNEINATKNMDVALQLFPELRAALYLPRRPVQALPIVIVMHGNHASCGRAREVEQNDILVPGSMLYTTTGACNTTDLSLHSNYVTSSGGTAGERSLVESLMSKVKAHASHNVEIPSFLGYEYMARELSNAGFIVLSISANRAIVSNGLCDVNCDADDPFGELAWSRLGLAHLDLLSHWNEHGGSEAFLPVDLRMRIDMQHVGLVGHSRGGLAVRLMHEALSKRDGSTVGSITKSCQHPLCKNLSLSYTSVPLATVQAVLEIAPTDFDSQGKRTSRGVPWLLLLADCDGDVDDLQGRCVYDRRATNAEEELSAMVLISGASHNTFNSQWHMTDSAACNSRPLSSRISGRTISSGVTFGDTTPRDIAKKFARHFFTGAMINRSWWTMLDPRYRASRAWSEMIVRELDYQPSGDISFDWLPEALTTGGVKLGHASDMCMRRAVLVQWNTCKVAHVDGTVVPNSCKEPSGKISCESGFHFTNGGCRPKVISGPGMKAQCCSPSSLIQTWSHRGLDVSAFESLRFSVGRAYSELNHDTSSQTDVMLGFIGSAERVPLSKYLASPLSGPPATFQYHSYIHERPAWMWGDVADHIKFIPRLQTVVVPLRDLGLLNDVVGLNITVDSFNSSGAIYLTPVWLQRVRNFVRAEQVSTYDFVFMTNAVLMLVFNTLCGRKRTNLGLL